MDKWEIKPLISVGPIKFGMSRKDLHDLFEEKCKEFKKTKYSKNTTDDYGKFHVYYTPDDLVDAVEIFEGIELTMNGNVIFPIKVSEIEKKITGIEKDENSYTHIEKSIGIEAGADAIDSILIGAKGYYG